MNWVIIFYAILIGALIIDICTTIMVLRSVGKSKDYLDEIKKIDERIKEEYYNGKER